MKELLTDKCSTIMAEAISSLLTTGEVQPAVYFGKGDSLQRMYLFIPDNPIEKIQMTGEIRKVAAKIGAEYVILVSDCWVIKQLESQPGLEPKKTVEMAMQLDSEVGRLLEYDYDSDFGFLTACPTNVGTGLRISVLIDSIFDRDSSGEGSLRQSRVSLPTEVDLL